MYWEIPLVEFRVVWEGDGDEEDDVVDAVEGF